MGFCWLCPYVVWGCFSGLIGCLCGLCPYVGDCFLFIRCFLFRADAPFPLFLGEVLSVFRFFWIFLNSCVFFVGLLPFWK